MNPVRFLITRAAWCVLACVSCGTARAHIGFESETEARVYPDRMELCIRTSPAFAWRMMGDEAPAPNAPDAESLATPVLERIAPGWIEVSSADSPVAAESARCVFEVDGHVAVLLRYPPPGGDDLRFRITFFDRIGPLDSSKLRVYDQREDPFDRGIDAFEEKEIFGSKPVAAVLLPGAEEASAPAETPAAVEKPAAVEPDPWRTPGILLAAGLGMALLAALVRVRARSRHRG